MSLGRKGRAAVCYQMPSGQMIRTANLPVNSMVIYIYTHMCVCVYLIVYLLYVFMYGSKTGSLPVADLW